MSFILRRHRTNSATLSPSRVRSDRVTTLFVSLVVSLVMGLFVGSCATNRNGPALSEEPVSLRMRALDDTTFSLEDLRGRPVLLTMITTWAETALVEVPRIKALAEKHPDLVVLCIVMEQEREVARIFARSFNPPYSVVTVDGLQQFTGPDGPFGEITVIPTSVLLDRKGRIAARMDGMWPPSVLETATACVLADERNCAMKP